MVSSTQAEERRAKALELAIAVRAIVTTPQETAIAHKELFAVADEFVKYIRGRS